MARQILLETLEAADGLELYCEVFSPQECKGVIIAIHDYGEHVGVHRALFAKLCQEGYKIYAQDLRGHGKSPAERGYIKRFDDFLEDLDLMLARVRDREAGQKIFLLGQGVGALVAARFTFSRLPRIAGLILCGLVLDLPLSFWQKTFLRYSTAFFARMGFAQDLGPVLFKPALEGHLKDDPLVFRGPLRLNSVREIFAACQHLQSEIPQLSCAVLSIQSSQSQVAKPSSIAYLIESIIAVDKISLSFASDNHHVLFHRERDQVIGDIIEWCEQRVSQVAGEQLDESREEFEDEFDAI